MNTPSEHSFNITIILGHNHSRNGHFGKAIPNILGHGHYGSRLFWERSLWKRPLGATNAIVGIALSDRFPTISGIRQRCVLVPSLFTGVIDWIMDTCLKSCKGLTVGGSASTDLDNADEIVLLVPSGDELGRVVPIFHRRRKVWV